MPEFFWNTNGSTVVMRFGHSTWEMSREQFEGTVLKMLASLKEHPAPPRHKPFDTSVVWTEGENGYRYWPCGHPVDEKSRG